MTSVSILGRGPSLLSVTREHVLDGYVIALNGAIYHHAVPADYWLGLDPPSYIPNECPAPWGSAAPIVITKVANINEWKRRWPGLAYITYAEKVHVVSCIPWKTAVDWVHWSIVTALHYAAFHLHATTIRLLGADLCGTAYAYSDAQIGSVKKPAEHYRWGRERRDVARAMTELQQHLGIEFDRGTERLVPRMQEWQCRNQRCKQPPTPLAYDLGEMTCLECQGILSGVLNRSPLDAIPRTMPVKPVQEQGVG